MAYQKRRHHRRGRGLIAYENTRTRASPWKTLLLPIVQAKRDVAATARARAQSGEALRTVASGDYRTTLQAIKTHLARSLSYLKYKYSHNLLLLEQWGWNVRQSARGGLTVRMPAKDAALLQLLDIYLAYETTLDPAERITDPSLATMQALQAIPQTHAQTRNTGRVQRSANVRERSTAADELLNLLQGIALLICLLEFNGKVHPNLARWGYHLLRVPSTAQPSDAEENE